jgi:hypothetical protein
MKIIALLTLLLAGCTIHNYPPSYTLVRDSYNTYAPVYAPTYAPVYSPTTTTYPQAQKKAAKKTIVRIIPGGAR